MSRYEELCEICEAQEKLLQECYDKIGELSKPDLKDYRIAFLEGEIKRLQAAVAEARSAELRDQDR